MLITKNFFYYSICHYCKIPLKNYKRCISCKSVAYCCPEHQSSDWSDHKTLCRAIKKTRQVVVRSNEPYTFEKWKSYRFTCLSAWKRFLNRDLTSLEYQVWLFQRSCAVCYIEDDLRDCSACYNVAYCCDQHEEQYAAEHRKFCKQLKLCLDSDRYLAEGHGYPTVPTDSIIERLQKAQGIQELLNIQSADDLLVEVALISEEVSPSATIHNALKHIDTSSFNAIVIHIVGSSLQEATMNWLLTSQFIFNLKPNLQTITFYLIGPEAWLQSSNVTITGKTVNFKVLKALYHEVQEAIEVPHLLVAFNCGFHENELDNFNMWERSLPTLFKTKETPLVFTCYTQEELDLDTKCLTELKELDLKFLYSGVNRFASMKPMRNCWSTDVTDDQFTPIFYSSAYIGIVLRSS